MINTILTLIYRYATLKNVLIFLSLDLVLMFGLMPMMGNKIADLTGGMQVIDLQIPTYSAQTALDMISDYGVAGRKLYRTIELTADTIYPIVYGIAYSLILAFLFKGNLKGSSKWRYLLPVIPLLGMMFDFCENIGIVTMLSRFPKQDLLLAATTGKFSFLKWMFAFVTILLIIYGLIQKLINK